MRTAICIVLMILMAGCSGATATPDVTLDHTACARCGMLVSDYAWAGAIRMVDGSERAFDDPSCLVKFVNESAEKPALVWFHEHRGESWIKAEEAAFVVQDAVRGPMGGSFPAFAGRQAAEQAAYGSGPQRVVTYAELLTEKEPVDGD